jgi:hypothetical protein
VTVALRPEALGPHSFFLGDDGRVRYQGLVCYPENLALKALPTSLQGLFRFRLTARPKSSLRLCLNNLVADRIAHEAGKGPQLQLAHDGRTVCLNCLEAELQKAGDKLV